MMNGVDDLVHEQIGGIIDVRALGEPRAEKIDGDDAVLAREERKQLAKFEGRTAGVDAVDEQHQRSLARLGREDVVAPPSPRPSRAAERAGQGPGRRTERAVHRDHPGYGAGACDERTEKAFLHGIALRVRTGLGLPDLQRIGSSAARMKDLGARLGWILEASEP